MVARKLKRINPLIWIFLVIVFVGLLLIRSVYVAYDFILAESRDYGLMDEMDSIGGHAEAYKHLNGSYPQSLADINKSDQYCVHTFNIKRCTTIHYKPSADLQDFKMAADATRLSGALSGTWAILFYSPKFSVSRDVMNSPGPEEYKSKYQNGVVCWFCAAYRSTESKQSIGPEDARPVYKQGDKYFSNPDEWPDIP